MSPEAVADLVETIAVKTESNTAEVNRLTTVLDAHITDAKAEMEAAKARQEAIMEMLGDILARLPDEKRTGRAPS